MTAPDTFTAHVLLPWPPRELWQNSRYHWRQRASATRQARSDGHLAAITGCLADVRGEGWQHRLSFDFCPPDRRKRDLQNMPATMKPYIDGIADYLKVDDSTFRISWPEEWGTVADDGGSVLVVVRATRASTGEG